MLGPTGAGKTTTLRLIAGLEKPDAGSVSIGGEDTAGWSVAQRDVALVFQYYSLYPRYTVKQNLAFPLKSRVRRFSADEIERRVARAAKMLRIEHLLERKTDRLSGGEMQRVSIGRAIVRDPSAFLMDEPLSNLDAKLREALRSELKDLKTSLGATFLFVTHDQIEAMSMGDQVGVLNEGRLVQVGTPNEIYTAPKDTFVAELRGVAGDEPAGRCGRRRTAGGARRLRDAARRAEGRARLGAGRGPVTAGRPRRGHRRSAPRAARRARVHHVENHGVEQVVTLRAGERLFKATVPAVAHAQDRRGGALRARPGADPRLRSGDRAEPLPRLADLKRPH